MKWTINKLTVSNDSNRQRLDQFLAAAEINLSRTLAKKIIDLGGVHVNGRRVRSCSLSVKMNDEIEVYIDHLPTDPYRIVDSDIVYRDQYLIVLNKPAFIDTQPTHARYKGTLYEALNFLLKDPSRPHKKVELGMIQRLDRGTSGLIVFSTHQTSHKKMSEIFLERRVEKRYLAVVEGVPDPPSAEICSFLARTRNANKVMTVKHGGKEAITRYRTAEKFSDVAMLEVEILTGRSHQIRAHLSEQGHPLLGDKRYGGPLEKNGVAFNRPMLHAQTLTFDHPVTGKQLKLVAPVAKDMSEAVKVLRSI